MHFRVQCVYRGVPKILPDYQAYQGFSKVLSTCPVPKILPDYQAYQEFSKSPEHVSSPKNPTRLPGLPGVFKKS